MSARTLFPAPPVKRKPTNCPLETTERLLRHLDAGDEYLRKHAAQGLYEEYGEAGFANWDAWYTCAPLYPGAAASRREWAGFGASIETATSMSPLARLYNIARNKDLAPRDVLEAVREFVYASPRSDSARVAQFPSALRASTRATPAAPVPTCAPQAAAAAPQPVKRRPAIDWPSLEGRDPPARKWALQHWIPDGNTTLLSGGGGVGKTLIAQHIATAAALGKAYIEPTEQRTVLFWAAEDDESELWRRQRPICDYFGATLSDLARKLHLHTYAGQDVTLMSPVYGQVQPTPMLDELRRQVHDYGARFVVLDNIARLFGGNENDRHAVTTFCALVQGACAPAAVLLLGHPAKAAQSEFSGSTAWEGAVRARLFMGYRPPDDKDEGEIDPRVRYLARRKANYGELGLRRFALHDGLLIPDAIDPNAPSAAVEALDVVLRAVRQLRDRGLYGATAKQSSNYLPKLAEQHGLLGPARKRDFEAAMVAALNGGLLLVREVGKYPNRTPRTGLVLSEVPDSGAPE